MNKLFTVCILLLFEGHPFAQTPMIEQQNKILAEAQRKLDSVMKNNPAVKKYLNKDNQHNAVTVPTVPALPANMTPPAAFIKKPDTVLLSKLKLPPRNNKALASIPAKTLTRDELKLFIRDLQTKLIPALKKYYNTENVNISSLGSTGASNAAALSWYKGRPDVALELALEGANMDPDDMNALNNLSGILDLCGFPYKAVPILKYIREKDPENSTVNNNLGQAYIKMGDAQNAKTYLQQAIAGSPQHPNANLTMAIISYAQGDKNSAQKYCENSLRGGFIPNAWNMLKSINQKVKLMDYIRHRYKAPETFNEHKFELLPQCRTVDEVARLQTEYTDYRSMLMAVRDKYDKKAKEESKYVTENLAKNALAKINAKKDPMRPFGWFANVILGDISETHIEKLLELEKYDKEFEANYKSLNDEYEAKKKEINDQYNASADDDGEGGINDDNSRERCNALNTLNNSYLPRFADLREPWQKKWIYEVRDYYNDYSFWCYMAAQDDHQYHQMFYQLVSEYLNLLEKLNRTRFIACLIHGDTTHTKIDPLEPEEGKCPLNAEIPFANLGKEAEEFEGFIGKIDIDCDNFGLELGEDLIFNFDRKFSTGETTLAFGAGKSNHIPFIPLIEGGAKMQFYITFGGETAWDIGIKWEAEMDIKGMYKTEQKAGWTVGINSGLDPHFGTFAEGELPNVLSDRLGKVLFGIEPEHQVNPNVRLYNSGGGKKE